MRDEPEPTCEVWPESIAPLAVFSRCSTQWNVSMAGPVGLRYESLPFLFDVLEVPRDTWPDVMEAVRVMETHTLSLIRQSKG